MAQQSAERESKNKEQNKITAWKEAQFQPFIYGATLKKPWLELSGYLKFNYDQQAPILRIPLIPRHDLPSLRRQYKMFHQEHAEEGGQIRNDFLLFRMNDVIAHLNDDGLKNASGGSKDVLPLLSTLPQATKGRVQVAYYPFDRGPAYVPQAELDIFDHQRMSSYSLLSPAHDPLEEQQMPIFQAIQIFAQGLEEDFSVQVVPWRRSIYLTAAGILLDGDQRYS